MSKLRRTTDGLLMFYCPGCEKVHGVGLRSKRPGWEYNGNPDAPTFSPSILVTSHHWDPKKQANTAEICHSFVRDGYIQFLSDCAHKLAGQTVELPEWPYAYREYGGLDE